MFRKNVFLILNVAGAPFCTSTFLARDKLVILRRSCLDENPFVASFLVAFQMPRNDTAKGSHDELVSFRRVAAKQNKNMDYGEDYGGDKHVSLSQHMFWQNGF